MAPMTGNEVIRTQQLELAERAEAARRRHEAQEYLPETPRTYTHVMRILDNANVAARQGFLVEARTLFANAFWY